MSEASTFSQTLEHFLTRFAAGAGSQYVWQLVDDHRLFAPIPRPDYTAYLCPISGQATHETGQLFYVADWKAASRVLRLSVEDRERIMDAADGLGEGDAGIDVLRARLLRICRLEEHPHG